MAQEKPAPKTPQKLTDEQKKKVVAWLKEHGTKGCPVCGHPKWALADDFVEVRPHYQPAIFGGVIYPAVMLVCENCNFLMLFHAVLVGAMEKPKPEAKKDAV